MVFFGGIIVQVWKIIHVLLATTSNTNDATSKTLLEVCMSPGCVADGAEATLRRLQALAPPGKVSVIAGGCVSGCGSGPIVREDEKNLYKRVASGGGNDLELLNSLTGVPDDLIKGYDIVCEAETRLEQKDYKNAVTLYQEGIRYALDIAIMQSKEDEEGKSNDNGIPTTPASLEWLVQAYRGLAESRLQLATGGDDQNIAMAIEAANEACEISNRSDPVCFELLAKICEIGKDTKGELNALKELFALPQSNKISRDEANRRRLLGFRLAKLENESK